MLIAFEVESQFLSGWKPEEVKKKFISHNGMENVLFSRPRQKLK